MSDEVILAPGELLAELSRPLSPVALLPRVTRSAADGLSAAHEQEVCRIADRAGNRDATLITLAFLRAHGNAASPEAVERWKPHVEKALRWRPGRHEP